MTEVEPGWHKHFAAILGISRTSYYRPRTVQLQADQLAAAQLQAVHSEHPFYGVRRLAIHLGWSHNKTRRIRTLAGVVAPRPGKRYKYKKGVKAEIMAPPNVLHHYAVFKNETRPQDGMDYAAMTDAEAWSQDFTYLWFLNVVSVI